MSPPTEIQVDEVTVGYGGTVALAGVSCAFGPGITGVLGPNGAGKSTLFKVLTGTVRPRSGSVLRDGRPVDGARAWQEHLAGLGYLPQDPGWFDGFTAIDLCRYVAGLRGMKPRSADEAADQALASVGLADHATTKLGALSGGMRRRAFIAQAIVHDPPILILDEPTSGLDPSQRVHLREMLATLGESRTILLSTHLVEDVALLARRILVLDTGTLVWEGSPEALTHRAARRSADPQLASLYERGFLALLAEEGDS